MDAVRANDGSSSSGGNAAVSSSVLGHQDTPALRPRQTQQKEIASGETTHASRRFPSPSSTRRTRQPGQGGHTAARASCDFSLCSVSANLGGPGGPKIEWETLAKPGRPPRATAGRGFLGNPLVACSSNPHRHSGRYLSRTLRRRDAETQRLRRFRLQPARPRPRRRQLPTRSPASVTRRNLGGEGARGLPGRHRDARLGRLPARRRHRRSYLWSAAARNATVAADSAG